MHPEDTAARIRGSRDEPCVPVIVARSERLSEPIVGRAWRTLRFWSLLIRLACRKCWLGLGGCIVAVIANGAFWVVVALGGEGGADVYARL